jgi:hypothetical protein
LGVKVSVTMPQLERQLAVEAATSLLLGPGELAPAAQLESSLLVQR